MSQPSQRRAHFTTFALENLWFSIFETVSSNFLSVPVTRGVVEVEPAVDPRIVERLAAKATLVDTRPGNDEKRTINMVDDRKFLRIDTFHAAAPLSEAPPSFVLCVFSVPAATCCAVCAHSRRRIIPMHKRERINSLMYSVVVLPQANL